MIVTHTSELSNISCDGVIIGWHLECNGYFEIKSSIIERSLKPYRFNKWTIYSSCGCTNDNYDHPHYIILTDSNEIRYVRQGKSTNSILLFYYYLPVQYEIYQFYFRCYIEMFHK